MTDVLDALANMRHQFLSAGLKPPAAVLLEDHEEGMRLLSEIRQTAEWVAVVGDPCLGRSVKMADGSVWMEIQVMGMKIRWPANRYAKEDGSWSYA